MKRISFFLIAATLSFISCNKEEYPSLDSICGTWVNDLAHPQLTLNIAKDGKSEINGQSFNIAYSDGILHPEDILRYNISLVSPASDVAVTLRNDMNFKITVEEDIMTWTFLFKDGGDVYFYSWFKNNGNFSRKISDGRWNSSYRNIYFTEYGPQSIAYIFNGENLEMYIFEWGWHLKGDYIQKNGVIYFNLKEAYYAKSPDKDDNSKVWIHIDKQTFDLTDGYTWEPVPATELAREQEKISSFTFAVYSDTEAYGGILGNSAKITKTR